MHRLPTLVLAAVCTLALAAAAAIAAPGPGAAPLPQSFARIGSGPAGGTLWQAPIRGRELAAPRPTVVYLPPHAATGGRYPVLYLLQGFPGSPYQYVDGLRLAGVADRLIASGQVAPFVAVLPPAGADGRYRGEWTGVWERYLVRDVVPWVDRHLPAQAGSAGRAIAGLSGGGYGAVDIALRHPGLFATIEAWSGYFTPYRDGSLAHAGAATLAAHDPSRLVREQAAGLRTLGVRFFLSAGTAERATARATRGFAEELRALGLRHRLWLGAGGHDGKLWRSQLPDALRYAFPAR